MLCLAKGRMVNQRKFHDPGPLPCWFLANVRIDTSDLGVTVHGCFPHALQEACCGGCYARMCRLIRTPLVDSPDFGGIRDAEKAVVEMWPSNQDVVLCMHTAA